MHKQGLNIQLHQLVIHSFFIHSECPYTVNESSEVTTMAELPAFVSCSLSDLGQFKLPESQFSHLKIGILIVPNA